MARIFHYADTKTTGAGKNDVSFLLVPRSLELFISLEENLYMCVCIFFELYFSVLSLLQILPPTLAFCDLYLKSKVDIPLWSTRKGSHLRSYDSWHISLKTDFCPHLGARIKILGFFHSFGRKEKSYLNFYFASSQGCASVTLYAHPEDLLVSHQYKRAAFTTTQAGTGPG